ncbi:DUF4476 domain-containing protein [Bdellovibrio bacteriovorus]|uniref:DUF4476 domain-containing protein n=1 Tax=Bdellovibrio TaxID=958 RepID=UPI0035A857F5
MKNRKCLVVLGLLSALVLGACSNDDNDKKSDNPSGPGTQRVHWDSIPSEFSPRKESFNLQTQNIQKIQMDLFGFTNDVQLQYSDKLPADAASIELFTVAKDSSYSLSGVNIDEELGTKTLKLNKYGSYACSIRIQNGKITELKGACYIRVLLTLPQNAEIEVYNVGKLISKRFIAMDNGTFLKDLDRASFQEDKEAVIQNYLESYRATGKTPALICDELGQVIEEFTRTEGKFIALRKLHAYVTDKENLAQMIEDKFSYFDRDEARRIVGLQ